MHVLLHHLPQFSLAKAKVLHQNKYEDILAWHPHSKTLLKYRTEKYLQTQTEGCHAKLHSLGFMKSNYPITPLREAGISK